MEAVALFSGGNDH